MKLTLLDRLTGRTITTDLHDEFEWTDGNYSCDCNRLSFFEKVEIDRPCVSEQVIVTHLNDQPVDFQEWNRSYKQ
jgi:hypothetical protein